jgi:prophage endopeptidase
MWTAIALRVLPLVAKLRPYAVLIGLVVWIASLTAVGVWQNKTGHAVERATWLERETTELSAANVEIMRLNAVARQTERLTAETLNQIAIQYEEDKTDALRERDAVIADLRAGNRRLRDPGATRQPGLGGASGSATSPRQCDGPEAGELSGQTSEFLVGLMAEADEVVKQLTACQAVIRADRETLR